MKKYLLLVAAAATLFAVSCNREKDFNGPDSKDKTSVIDDSVPMPVVFTTQYVATRSPEVQTRGLGAIDDWRGAYQKLYIYGFPYKRVEKGVKSYEWIDYSEANSLIYNVAADAPEANGDHEGVRLDGSQRSKINVYNPKAVGETGDPLDDTTWEGSAAMEPFFYREDNEYGEPLAFSFFAYFVDDAIANPVPVVTEGTNAPTYNEDGSVATQPAVADHGSIVLTGLTLDGTQDIMLATTDKEVDALARSRYLDSETYQTNLELTKDDLGEYIEASRIYSAHAARRGVNPDLIFEHQLSRITFYIKKGGSVPSSDITMAGIDLFDYYEGTLTIADGVSGLGGARGLAPVNTGKLSAQGTNFNFDLAWQDDMFKENETPDADYQKYIKTVRQAEDVNTPITAADGIHPYKEPNKFGQSVLVFPGREKIDMILKIMQVGATAIGYRPYKTHLEIKNDPDENGQPVLFEAGKNYNVYLTVYGLEEVRISVTLTEWDDTRIDLDPDLDDDDMREPAQILFGTDRTVDPNGIHSEVDIPAGPNGTPAAKDNETYEDFVKDAGNIPYANPNLAPHGQLTIRNCDDFDLLSTQMFVKGDPLATPTPTEDHYETVLAYVRSNSNGSFHFSLDGVNPVRSNVTGLLEYENSLLLLTEDGKIYPKEDQTGTATITVRQNSSNDFLAANPRKIDLTIAEDDRVKVQINWLDKTGESGQEAAIKILNEDGGSGTLDMNATFSIDYTASNDPTSDPVVTYALDYFNVGTTANPIWGWMPLDHDGKITSASPLSGPDAVHGDLTTAEKDDFVRFDLRFRVIEGSEYIRIDAKTGTITALATTPGVTVAKVEISLDNLANDDTYTPVKDTIDVKIEKSPVNISGVPAAMTIKYGKKDVLKPIVSAGAGAVSYTSATPETVAVGASDGVIFGKTVGGPINVTVSVNGGHFYDDNTATCAVTVEKADPVVHVNSITINADATDVVTEGVAYEVVAPEYAGEGIAAYAGTITYDSSDTGVFTVDADGKITAVATGRATLLIHLAEETNYNAAEAQVTVIVKALANTFNLTATLSVAQGATTAALWTTAEGAVTLNAVTKAGVPVPSYGSKFVFDPVAKTVAVDAGVAVGDYELTFRAAGDGQHLAATKKLTLTVTAP